MSCRESRRDPGRHARLCPAVALPECREAAGSPLLRSRGRGGRGGPRPEPGSSPELRTKPAPAQGAAPRPLCPHRARRAARGQAQEMTSAAAASHRGARPGPPGGLAARCDPQTAWDPRGMLTRPDPSSPEGGPSECLATSHDRHKLKRSDPLPHQPDSTSSSISSSGLEVWETRGLTFMFESCLLHFHWKPGNGKCGAETSPKQLDLDRLHQAPWLALL